MTSKQQTAIALCNPKSPSNVGAALRAAGCYNAKAIYYDGNRYKQIKKLNLDTKNRKEDIPLIHVDSFIELKATYKNIICIEFAENACSLPDFKHPEEALYVFGPEDGSISQNLIDIADDVVYIPTNGCMNLAATVNVALYDRLAKQNQAIDHNQLIKQNRDKNNRLVLKT